jgi:uncharacterized membrane protein YkvA (DUF1232 family)
MFRICSFFSRPILISSLGLENESWLHSDRVMRAYVPENAQFIRYSQLEVKSPRVHTRQAQPVGSRTEDATMGFFKKLVQFIRNVAEDERIPPRDKKVILTFLALVLSPIDLIPDWIPIIGLLDDLVIIAFVLDYFFNVLDDSILLSHYPWGMKSFTSVRRGAKVIAVLTPQVLKDKIWKYQPAPY